MRRNMLGAAIGMIAFSTTLMAAEPTPGEVPTDLVRKSVAKSLTVLWKGVEGHTTERSCVTCHHHGVPLLAITTARSRGFDVANSKITDQDAFMTEYLESMRERFKKGQGPGPSPSGGRVDTTGWAMLALDSIGHKPDRTTEIVVEYTLLEDKNRDHWTQAGNRPPSERSAFTTNYLAIRTLRRFGTPDQKERIDRRVESAKKWLLATPAADTEDRVFRLLALHEAQADSETIRQSAKHLAETQRSDGGWSQLADMESDAYATGSALVALQLAGGVVAADPNYLRGVQYLLKTQLPDGSWHVRTRSRPFQKYFETGFPHGKDQFISMAATGWATTALALTCPAPPKR